jgi:hypothetical protein
MDARKQAIAALTARGRQLAEENREQLAVLGEYLATLKPGAIRGTKLEEGYLQVKELQKELPHQRRQARSIVRLVEQHRAKQELLAENRRKTGDLEKRNEEVCEEIGRAAFRAYQHIPDRRGQYGGLFTRLEELDNDFQQRRAKIESLEQDARQAAFLARIKIRSRVAYLKSMLALKNRELAGSFRKTGREICESEFVDKIQDETFTQAIWPYMENKKQILTLQEQKAQLESRQEEIWAELKSLGAEKSHEKKVRELEKVIAETESRLKDSCLALGMLYRKNPVPALKENDDIKAIIEELERAQKMKARDQKQINRLKADLQAEEISRELEKTREQIERLNVEIAGRKEDVAALEQSLRDKESERARLLKRRGPESSLLAIEAPKKTGKEKA